MTSATDASPSPESGQGRRGLSRGGGVLCILAAGVCGFVLRGVLMPSADGIGDDIRRKLESEHPADRWAIVDTVAEHRHEMIEFALALATRPDDGKTHMGKKECGIRLLGKMRAEVAVPLLLDEIHFNPPSSDMATTEVPGHPAVHALIGIGTPAARDILEFRLARADAQTRRLYLYILKCVWGPEISRTLVKARLEEELPEDARANFQAALEYFEAEIRRPRGHK